MDLIVGKSEHHVPFANPFLILNKFFFQATATSLNILKEDMQSRFKKILLIFVHWSIILAFISGQTPTNAQGILEMFQGGIIGADLRIGGSGLSGFSGTFNGIGGSISQLTPGGESVRWNPVGLAYINKAVLYSEWVPPISLDLNPVLDIEKRANDKLHENIDEINDGSEAEQSIEDFVIKPSLGMDGGQGNYAAVAKTRYFVIGGAVHSPSRVLADIGISGTKFLAATESGGAGTTIRLLGILSGTLSSEIKISGYSIAIAKMLPYNIGFGLGLDDYSATLSTIGVVQPEAQVSSGSEEFIFNNPEATHYDSLNANTKGFFKGGGTRFRFGLGYHIGDWLAIDMAYFAPYSIDLNGNMDFNYNQILAFTTGGDNFFDAAQLLEDDYTGTHKRTTKIHDVRLKFTGRTSV
ncbi:MAG: hypothetical protein DWQ10_06720, partial [Calditrichaeota bacterium]